MLVDESSLSQVVIEAKQAKAAGKDYVYVDIIPRGPTNKYIDLWEGSVGQIIGMNYQEDGQGNPDLPSGKVVKSLRLRVRAIDIIEAGKREAERLEKDLAKPLRANRIESKVDTSGTTTR